MQLVAYGAQDVYLTGNSVATRYIPSSNSTPPSNSIPHSNSSPVEPPSLESPLSYVPLFNENESYPHCRGEYPETTFLCGKAQILSLVNLHKKHNLEEQDNESPCNKKSKLG